MKPTERKRVKYELAEQPERSNESPPTEQLDGSDNLSARPSVSGGSLSSLVTMHRFFVTLGLWLTFVVSAHGVSVEIPVTTTNLDQHKYRFSISTNAAAGGVAFHVIVTAKKEDIHVDSEVGLSIVTHTKTRGEETDSIENVEPEISVRLKKDKRVWEADFTVSSELLEEPGLCLVFTDIAHATVDGKSVAMPSAEFYEIRLRDFLRQ